MAWFRRKQRETTPEGEQTAPEGPLGDVDEPEPESAEGERLGPFDVTDMPDPEGFVDLGALRLPAVDGLVLTMEVDESTGDVTAVRVHLGESLLQVQAFAAPKTSGIWSEIRAEIAEGLRAQGGSCDEVEGPFGAELVARVPGRGTDGRTMSTPMRFLGIDGPRWFLRGVVSGPAATDEALARPFVDLLHVTVVVRGQEPMGPRELLPLRLPEQPEAVPRDETVGQADAGDEPVSTDDLRPFERGPEITEIR